MDNILLLQGIYACQKTAGAYRLIKDIRKRALQRKVFHLHLRREGDNDELYFRDHLNQYPDTAKEYEKLKLGLWKRYEHNRDSYTDAKTDFVKKYTLIAKDIAVFKTM